MNIAIMGEGPWVGVLVRKIERLHCQTIRYRDVKGDMGRVARLMAIADLSVFWIDNNDWDFEFELGLAIGLSVGRSGGGGVLVKADPSVTFSGAIEDALASLDLIIGKIAVTFDNFSEDVYRRVRIGK